MAPVNLRDPRMASALLQFATRYAAKQVVHLGIRDREGLPGTPDELQHMEVTHQVLVLFCSVVHLPPAMLICTWTAALSEEAVPGNPNKLQHMEVTHQVLFSSCLLVNLLLAVLRCKSCTWASGTVSGCLAPLMSCSTRQVLPCLPVARSCKR